MRNKIIGTAIVAIAGLSLTACGSGGKAALNYGDETPTTATSSVLRTVSSDLGQIVSDSSGHTLYAFTKDTSGSSTCYDACATAWPAALVTDASLVGNGIDSGLIGTTVRKDGTKQLTLSGMPLYRFAADGDAAAQLKGQANKGVWFVLNNKGALVHETVTSSTTTTAIPTPTTASPRYNNNY